VSRGRRRNPVFAARGGPSGVRREAPTAPPGPASCNAVRLIHMVFGDPRYPDSRAPHADARVPVRVECGIKGPHKEHVGPGGWRW
jgi:hypothetical protein